MTFKLTEGIPREVVNLDTHMLGRNMPTLFTPNKEKSIVENLDELLGIVRDNFLKDVSTIEKRTVNPNTILKIHPNNIPIPRAYIYITSSRPETDEEYTKNLPKRILQKRRTEASQAKKLQEELDTLKSLANKHGLILSTPEELPCSKTA